MKPTITTFLLGISVITFSQVNQSYTSFIQQDTAIQWAAECDKVINLTPKVSEYSLKKWYADKIRNGTAMGYSVNNEKKSVKSYQLSMPHLDIQPWLKGLSVELSPYRHPQEWYFYDNTLASDNYDRYKFRAGRLNPAADSCCGCDEADAFRAKQILTYKNGEFSIYNVFISPLCLRKTEFPPSDWYPLCNVAYNNVPEEKMPDNNRDLVLLNTDYLDYNFNNNPPFTFDSVLTVHRPGIISVLLHDLKLGKIRALDFESGEIISGEDLLTWKMPVDTVPVYDSNDPGKLVRYETVKTSRNPDKLNRFRMVLDHWFDFKNEKLYSVLRSVMLLETFYLPDGKTIRGYAPFCILEKVK